MYQNRVAPPVPGGTTATANLADPHVPQGSGVVVANRQIVLLHLTLEENREEQQLMEYEANQILNQNRAQAVGRPYRNQNGDATVNANQQQDFEVGVEQTLNAEETFSRMVEDMMYAKIPDKYEEPTIVKMTVAGIQDYKVKLAVEPHSIRSLNHLVDIVRRCKKVGAPAGTPGQVEEANVGRVYYFDISHIKSEWLIWDSEVLPSDTCRITGCDDCDKVFGRVKCQLQELGSKIGGHLHRQVSRQPAIEVDIVINGQTQTWVQKETHLDLEQEKLRVVSDAILSALNQQQQPNVQHLETRDITPLPKKCLPLQTRFGKPMNAERINDQCNDQTRRPSAWQRIGRPATQSNILSRVVKAVSVNDGFPSIKFLRQEQRRSQFWERPDTYFPPVNMEYTLPKSFCLQTALSSTPLAPKPIENPVMVPETTSFVMEPYDTTMGGIQLLLQEGKSLVIMLSQPAEDATSHIRPLYICAVIDGITFKRVLVDNGAAINILPSRALRKLGKHLHDLVSTEVFVSDFFTGDVTSTKLLKKFPIKTIEQLEILSAEDLDAELLKAKQKQEANGQVLQYFENEHQRETEMPSVCWDDEIYDTDPISDSDVIELNELATATSKLSDDVVVTKEPVKAVTLAVGDLLASQFQHIEFYNVERDFNTDANDMAQLALEYLKAPLDPDIAYDTVDFDALAYVRCHPIEVLSVDTDDTTRDWCTPIINILRSYPGDSIVELDLGVEGKRKEEEESED
ncbi:OLC1v1000128C1 [Oldenlandia corymbosa var. corymbosa]|uniref:OLC1v1000128C1 n=1 Tax=Oldenlandia corymbosa var. corymbosa TaxID=529605 RepID=A0AAV1D251_OLDCO|nr:OLC1v1000128C1 [Oldenlandia corymbosa var. corymbosa]